MVIDCDSCAVRGLACGDCVVSVVLGGPPADVGDDVDVALRVLAAADLVGGLVRDLRVMPDPVERPRYGAPASRAAG